MKYLKRIFESNCTTQEVKEFCESYLAYLLDSAEFSITIRGQQTENFLIWLQKTEPDPNSDRRNYCSFTWDEIRDHYIPFILMLSKTYKLDRSILKDNKSIFINFEEDKIGESKHDQMRLSIDEIESISISKRIDEVGVIIENKKL